MPEGAVSVVFGQPAITGKTLQEATKPEEESEKSVTKSRRAEFDVVSKMRLI